MVSAPAPGAPDRRLRQSAYAPFESANRESSLGAQVVGAAPAWDVRVSARKVYTLACISMISNRLGKASAHGHTPDTRVFCQ